MNWPLIWQIVFVGLLLAFAVMSVLIVINGAHDIRRLLSYLEETSGNADSGDCDVTKPE
ncbi:MAG: hypothetical protein MK110_10355 [Fuerstiella sp.]|nr:hypothetical protein [Fuerstiella sp.]